MNSRPLSVLEQVFLDCHDRVAGEARRVVPLPGQTVACRCRRCRRGWVGTQAAETRAAGRCPFCGHPGNGSAPC